jgi:hypothetical protein
MSDCNPPGAKQSVDYTGLKIVAILAPVFFLFVFLGNADMGLTACIVLGMIILAIKLRWNLRKHVWFWATIIFVLALHIPLFWVVRWPQGEMYDDSGAASGLNFTGPDTGCRCEQDLRLPGASVQSKPRALDCSRSKGIIRGRPDESTNLEPLRLRYE